MCPLPTKLKAVFLNVFLKLEILPYSFISSLVISLFKTKSPFILFMNDSWFNTPPKLYNIY